MPSVVYVPNRYFKHYHRPPFGRYENMVEHYLSSGLDRYYCSFTDEWLVFVSESDRGALGGNLT